MVLPKGWTIAPYKSTVIKVSIANDKKIKQRDYLQSGAYPVIDQGADYIGGYTNDEALLVNSPLPAIIFGDHTKVIKFVKNKFCAGADGIKVVCPPEYFDPQCLYYFICVLANKIPDKGYARHYQHLEKENLSIPPLAEQHRIVAKIDALFSKLDKGVDVLQTVRQQLRTYRQAVLKWAFEGNEWELVPMSLVTSFVTSGSRGWAQYYADDGAKFIRISNLTREGIKLLLDDIQCVLLPDKAEGLRSRLQQNDMLISITADLGSIGIVPANFGEAYINQHIALTRFNYPALVVFYAWYLKCDKGRKSLLRNQRGGTKVGLGLDDVRDTLVPHVSDELASDVVAAIESRLSVCDKIEQIVDENLAKAQALRQSILKKAFTGRLVPQDPNDEPAEKLLERIKAAKTPADMQSTAARRKRK